MTEQETHPTTADLLLWFLPVPVAVGALAGELALGAAVLGLGVGAAASWPLLWYALFVAAPRPSAGGRVRTGRRLSYPEYPPRRLETRRAGAGSRLPCPATRLEALGRS